MINLNYLKGVGMNGVKAHCEHEKARTKSRRVFEVGCESSSLSRHVLQLPSFFRVNRAKTAQGLMLG